MNTVPNPYETRCVCLATLAVSLIMIYIILFLTSMLQSESQIKQL